MMNLPPGLFNFIVFTIVLMSILTAAGIGYGLFQVVEYERNRRRARMGSDDQLGAPMIGAT
jgi:hypothetical protein